MEDIKWDRTELSVDDVNQDSPIWRAAITSLSRRTIALEAACRAILEAVDALRRQLLSTQSAQASLDEAFSALGRVAPGFGACANLTLFAERDRESTRLAKLLADLQQHVKSPAEVVLGHCQRAQELQRTFDIESKDYYAYVQRWLAVPALSRSAPLSLKSEQAASDGIQQRLDLSFALLRLELYSSLWALHGGEDELLLATHCLEYASHSLADHAPDSLQSPVQCASAAAQLSEQRQVASVRRAEIELRILSLRMQLGRGSPTERDDEHLSTSSSRTSPPKSAFDHHKFKRILGGSYAQTSMATDNHAQRRNPMRHLRDKINKRGEKIQPQSGLMDGFSPRSDAAPITKDLHAPVAVITSPAAEDDAQTPQNQPLMSNLLAASPPKRSVSVNGGPMLPSQHSTMRKARAGHTSVALGDSDINSSLMATRHRDATNCAPPLHKQPTQSERRKEGLLWIMSRNLQSPVGADAPKSANKASHWQDSWVVLSNGQLGEYADWRDVHTGATTLSPNNTPIDLRFASVKDAKGMNRRWAFEVVTRDSVRRFYQARSQKEMREWVAAINRAIESLLNGTGTVRQVDKVVAIDRELDHAKSPTLPGLRSSAESNGFSHLRDTSNALLPLVDKTPRRSRKQSSLGAGSPVAEAESPWSHLPLISRNGRRSVGSGISNVTPVFDYVSAKNQPDASREKDSDKHDYQDLSNLSGIAFPRTSLGQPHSTPPSPQRDLAGEIVDIARLPGNNECFDCKASDPQWASWALHGQLFVVFLCIRCSGLHRGLGVQISKVKSVTLDQWTPSQVAAARRCGNLQGRLIWEAHRPTSDHSPANLTADFWKQKYVVAAWRDNALWRQVCQQTGQPQVVNHQSEPTKTPAPVSGGFEEDHHPRLALDTRRPSRASIDLLRGPASLVPSLAR